MNTKPILLHYFTKGEILLWSSSVLLISLSFLVFDRENYLVFAASLIGATSLIFNAKGNPFGQVLMIVFSLLYGMISLSSAYYGEMVTYMGMTAPMAVLALISWLRHPYNGSRAQVQINRLQRWELLILPVLTLAVTFVFYWILRAFHTANLIPSTLSVTTSFLAVYLTFRRSACYALAYAANDAVLIILWILAAWTDIAYFSVIVCFAMFFVNDLYGYRNWSNMQKHQQEEYE